MKMQIIREKAKSQIEFARETAGLEALASYIEYMLDACNKLYTNGFVKDWEVTDDLLRLANGFQARTGNYGTFHISQTWDLRVVKVDDRKTARDFAEYALLN